MRKEIYRCDACRKKVTDEDESRGRLFTLGTPYRMRELDICRDCWERMCAAVGMDPNPKDEN